MVHLASHLVTKNCSVIKCQGPIYRFVILAWGPLGPWTLFSGIFSFGSSPVHQHKASSLQSSYPGAFHSVFTTSWGDGQAAGVCRCDDMLQNVPQAHEQPETPRKELGVLHALFLGLPSWLLLQTASGYSPVRSGPSVIPAHVLQWAGHWLPLSPLLHSLSLGFSSGKFYYFLKDAVNQHHELGGSKQQKCALAGVAQWTECRPMN